MLRLAKEACWERPQTLSEKIFPAEQANSVVSELVKSVSLGDAAIPVMDISSFHLCEFIHLTPISRDAQGLSDLWLLYETRKER